MSKYTPPDLTVIGWKIYYVNNTIYSSKDGSWIDAPNDGVVVVLVYFKGMVNDKENYRRQMSGEDYYWRIETNDGIIFGQGTAYDPSIPMYNGKPDSTGIVKKGSWLPDVKFVDIYQRAYHDCLWVE